ncbi:DHH family phosphoesterase [Rhizophagus clarus]|uniref:DHH family phosphoesterase n=1 Tax=Rhizophagus clarus TaxID=94130 RepID=A0A8H3QZ99_9GLOM|nr:DHH family phosphoesterase [Rhizophagus clarus]
MIEFVKIFSLLINENVNEAIATQQQKKIYFVLGNESADLDSIISSIAYAYLSQQLISSDELKSSATSFSSIYLPIIQIPKSDFSLRPECSYVFSESKFSESDISQLLFLDDILPHLDKLSSNYDVNLILVDHNKLISPWSEKFNDKIDTILDHHQDEGLYLNIKSRQIESVGSATSLVVLHFKDDWVKKTFQDDSKLSKLLLAPILIDTVLLDVSKGRTSNKDKEAVQFLLDILNIPKSDQEFFTSNYYKAIQSAKLNISHLSNIDLLRKDYKEWNLNNFKIGISSIPWFIDGWIQREDKNIDKLIDSFKYFKNERKLDIFIIIQIHLWRISSTIRN